MKRNVTIFQVVAILFLAIASVSCNKVRRSPGRAYMPDMAYSRAYETYYTSAEELKQKGINYDGTPVSGTIARGDMLFIYPYKNDSAGYAQSGTVRNPLVADSIDMTEAERLYLVNCGICHGAKLDGNGPLWKGGDGPYPVAPRNLISDPLTVNMTEGTMFHSITYGKGQMGSYASQLNVKQRWEVIAYIKKMQSGAAAKPAAAATDSTAAK